MSRGRYRSSLSPAEKQRRMASFPFMALLECLGSSSEILPMYSGRIPLWIRPVPNPVRPVPRCNQLRDTALSLCMSPERDLLHIYLKPKHMMRLLLEAILGSFVYRQLNSMRKLISLYRWMIGKKVPGKLGLGKHPANPISRSRKRARGQPGYTDSC